MPYVSGMRFLMPLCLALTACAADPVLLPDSGPCSSACGAGTVCSGGACVAVDAGTDAGGTVDLGAADTGVDAGTGIDILGIDIPRTDVAEDRPATDTGTPDAGRCPNGPTGFCDGRNVRFTTGEPDAGGLVHHCGACGVSCAEGEVCDACRCAR